MSNRLSRNGFTLTELMVVIGIIILVSLVTIPAMIPFLRGQRLRSGARTVQSAVLGARTQAIRRRATVDLIFDATLQYMQIVDVSDASNYVVLGKGAKLPDTISFTGAVTTINFSPFGYATAGPTTIGLQDASGNTLTLNFQASTGQVRRPR